MEYKSWKALVINLRLFPRPLFVSLTLSLTWYYVFFRNGIHFPEEDESSFTDAIVPILAAFHAILAGFVLNKVWSEYSLIGDCIKSGDHEAFKRIVGNRIPMAIHLLLGSFAVMIQLFVMLLHYVSPVSGVASTLAISFVLVMYWEVAINLDDPRKGVWYVNRIPAKWLEEC